ncbi:MAG: nitrous oxide-stimulated promoter family protein [Candidatus Marinimicrobia bacterium]|nr:nitrous oxide-stimulated promoter family protein [Candidatus Neomarinimicrobiota bacterium]
MTTLDIEKSLTHPRTIREKNTVDAMIKIYCHYHHSTDDILCSECKTLSDYAEKRLIRCPFGHGKTTCVNCTVHCYKNDMRHDIKKVMRFAGPRMLFKHPIYTLFHYWDGLRKKPLFE